jgi:hypothetical protein
VIQGSLRDYPEGGRLVDAGEWMASADPGPEGWSDMSTGTKYLLGGAAAAVIAFILLPNWIALLLIIGVPVAGYLMLDPSQRRRLRQAGRKQIGR